MSGTAMWLAFSLLPLAVLAVAAWRDLATRTIPDALPVALVLIGLGLRARDGLAALGMSVGVAFLLFVMFAALHARGWLGGGDVKLVAGCAVGLAPQAVLPFLVATGLIGGVLAALYLVLRFVLPEHHVRGRNSLSAPGGGEGWGEGGDSWRGLVLAGSTPPCPGQDCADGRAPGGASDPHPALRATLSRRAGEEKVSATLFSLSRSAGEGGERSEPGEGRVGALRRLARIERWRIARRGSLPYGVAIACGGAWAIFLRLGT